MGLRCGFVLTPCLMEIAHQDTCMKWSLQMLFRQDRQDNTSYLVDFIHPIAGVLKHQFAGLHGSRHCSEVQRATTVLQRLLVASLRTHADELFSSLPCWDFPRSCDLDAQRPTGRPRRWVLAVYLAQVGAASPPK